MPRGRKLLFEPERINMKMKLSMLGIIAVVAISATALAITDGFRISRKPKEGETIKYRMTADVDFGGMAIKAKFLVAEKVTKVEADGTYKVEQNRLEGKVDVNGQEQDAPGGGASTTTYAANGEVKEVTGDNTTGDTYRMANLGVLIDPAKDLAINDTWTYEGKADKKTGAVAVKGEFKLLGEEKIGEWDTLKVKATLKETEGTDPASSDGTIWINKADGTAVQMESKWVNFPFPGAPAPINATVKMVREPAAK